MAIKPRPNKSTPHTITVYHDKGSPDVRLRDDKDEADFEYNRGVSLVNRNAACCVTWDGPNGRLYKKWGKING
jgi:hypothetical protein